MNDKQSPKVCPVTGVFLEEPERGQNLYIIGVDGKVSFDNGYKGEWLTMAFEQGNCFATREDAERYAKHLKAMAKLRRLGGSNGVWWSHSSNVNSRWICHGIERSAYNQLTPEERNALKWPDEEE